MNAQKGTIKLNRFLIGALLMLLAILVLLVAFFGNYGVSVSRRREQESMDYILNMYNRNLSGALEEIEGDLQDILASQSTLQLLLDRSSLRRWQGSYSLSSLLTEKRTSTEDVDGYAVMDSVYEGFILARSTNIAYGELDEIKKCLSGMAKQGIRSSGWISTQIGKRGCLLKYYNYGGVIIAAFLTEPKIQEILSHGQSEDNVVDFYVVDSGKKIICSSNPEWEYGEELLFEEKPFAPKVLLRAQEVMGGACYVGGSMERGNFVGENLYFFMILGLLLVSLLFLLIILQFVNREVLRPVKILSDISATICRGNMMLRPQYVCRNKEMSELRDAYVMMLDTITELKIQEYERIIQVKDSELKYLHMQLKPHFFLNALSTINSMAYQSEKEDIHQFIRAFSRTIRYMFRVGLHTVSLEEEVKSLEEYLEMQRFLYKENFYYYFNIPEETKNYRIPQMILHTFIENIFKHVMDINSFVTIFMRCSFESHNSQEMLKIEIHNSGKCFEEEILRKINEDREESEGGGIGLSHIKKILAILYGQEHLLLLENEEPEGSKVTVWIPREVQNEVIDS